MKTEQPVKILVRRRAALGDVIMATGVVRELYKKYNGNCHIAVATEHPDIFRNNPYVAEIYHSNQPPDPYTFQVYVDLDDAYETNPTEHYVDNYFYRAFGDDQAGMDKSVDLIPSATDKAFVDPALAEIGDKFICVHIRNWFWAAKNVDMNIWFEVFAKVFEQRADFKVVCVGGNNDQFIDLPMMYDATGKFNTQQLKYLMDHAACFVGIDSGPMQAAAASSTHIVALLTHLKPERILPYRNGVQGDNCTAILASVPCQGCNDKQVRPVRTLNCEMGDYPCNRTWDTDAIAAAILETLK